jgi:hypothetical protein
MHAPGFVCVRVRFVCVWVCGGGGGHRSHAQRTKDEGVVQGDGWTASKRGWVGVHGLASHQIGQGGKAHIHNTEGTTTQRPALATPFEQEVAGWCKCNARMWHGRTGGGSPSREAV